MRASLLNEEEWVEMGNDNRARRKVCAEPCAVLGAISAVAIIAYLVYCYMTPAFEDDYYDDDFDDFEDDFDEDDYITEE